MCVSNKQIVSGVYRRMASLVSGWNLLSDRRDSRLVLAVMATKYVNYYLPLRPRDFFKQPTSAPHALYQASSRTSSSQLPCLCTSVSSGFCRVDPSLWDSYFKFGFVHFILFHYRLLLLWTVLHHTSGSLLKF
jgi:hypothetical protein